MDGPHQGCFKNSGLTLDKLRKNRIIEQNECRKRRREDELKKLRFGSDHIDFEDLQGLTIFDSNVIAGLESTDDLEIIRSLKVYHFHLSKSSIDDGAESVLDDVISLGLPPLFFDIFLRAETNSALQLHALYVIADIVCDDENGIARPKLLIQRLIEIISLELEEQHVFYAFLVLNFISKASQKERDICLECGAMEKTIDVFQRLSSKKPGSRCLEKIALKFLNGLLLWDVDVRNISHAYLLLIQDLFASWNSSSNTDDHWVDVSDELLVGIVSISGMSTEHVDLLIASKFIDHVCSFLCGCLSPPFNGKIEIPKTSIFLKAMQILSNVALCGTSYTKMLHENYDIFYTFWKLIEDSTLMVGNSREFTSELRSEASLTMMCILKMDANDYNVVLERNYANYFARILSTGPYRLRREAVFVLHILLTFGNSSIVMHVIDCGVIVPLCDMLTVMDVETVICTLECIREILNFSEHEFESKNTPTNSCKEKMEEQGILDKLEFLMRSENLDVYLAAQYVIERFFTESDALQECDLASINCNQNNYNSQGRFNF